MRHLIELLRTLFPNRSSRLQARLERMNEEERTALRDLLLRDCEAMEK